MKKTKKKKSKQKYHLLMYIEDSNPKLKKFLSTQEMGKFIDEFGKKYPGQEAADAGFWIDFAITNVGGEVHFFTNDNYLE
jgi:hypothetical protein